MLEYDFVPVPLKPINFKFAGFLGYQDIIREKAAEGWAYVGYVPSKVSGPRAEGLAEIELVFQRQADETK